MRVLLGPDGGGLQALTAIASNSVSPTIAGKYLAIGAHQAATAIIACNTCYGWLGGQNEDDKNCGKRHRHVGRFQRVASVRLEEARLPLTLRPLVGAAANTVSRCTTARPQKKPRQVAGLKFAHR